MNEIQSLQNLWQLRPEVFMDGMRAMENVRSSDQAQLTQQQQAAQQATLQNQFTEQMNPIKMEQARFGLMKDRAMFPGEQAIQEQTISRGKQAQEQSPEKMMSAMTAAAAIAQNPSMQTPALHGVMKQTLGQAYHPVMDTWTPQQFAQLLPDIVQRYSAMLPKQQGVERLQELKDTAAFEREQEKTRRGESITRIQAAAKRAGQSGAPKDITGLPQYAARLLKQADDLSGIGATEEDLARAEVLRGLGNEYMRQIRQDAINKATAGSGGAIDPGALLGPGGKPRFPVKPQVVPTVPQVPQKVAPSTGGPYTNEEKERRYQEWVKKQQGG